MTGKRIIINSHATVIFNIQYEDKSKVQCPLIQCLTNHDVYAFSYVSRVANLPHIEGESIITPKRVSNGICDARNGSFYYYYYYDYY